MRIGLIGAGSVAELHALAADQIDGVQLTAVCDLIEDAAATVAAPRAAAVYTDWRALLDSGGVDAVIVNTPHVLHPAMAVAAAERGIHVLVEKPMAINLTDCDRMIAACAAADVRLAVGHIQHFMPDKVAARAVIDNGELGAPLLLHDFRSTDYRPGSRPDWFLSRTTAGGGVLMNIGAHCIDRCLWLGNSDVIEVSATTNCRFGVPVETDATLLLRSLEGVTTTITIVSDLPDTTDELTIVCERGVLVADPRRGTILRLDGRTTVVSSPTPQDVTRAFHAQLLDFVAHVRDGNKLAVSVDQSRRVVDVVLTAYAAAAGVSQPLMTSDAAMNGAGVSGAGVSIDS